MIHASRILHHSRKLRHTYNAKQKDHVSLVRWFTHHARKSVNDTDDVPGLRHLDLGHGDKHSTPRIPSRGSSSPSPQSINETTKSTVGMVKGSVLWTARNRCSPAIGLVYKRQNSIRYFSTESGLPPHQEIGMPSLSPTMTEGNIARWLKKEGEKLSPGEVLCEVETDKATVEMECMEEGFLAKIVLGDGSTGIKVGEIIAITVEEEEDITKFKDYSPSTSEAAASAPTPTPPKEVPVAAASSPEPKTKANDSCPHQEIGMPSLSPTMTEGNIARWLKKQGEKLSPGEVLCEVETDKATVEMECMEEGYLAKIVCGDGSTGIKVGEIIAVTVENEGDVAKFKDYTPSASDAAAPSEKPSPPTSPKPNVSKPSEPSSTGDGISISPLTTLLAKDQKNASPSNKSGTSSGEQVVKADGEDHPASHGKSVSATVDNTDIPQTQIRKVTASRLLKSKQTIPHYYLSVDTRVDKLMEVRSQLNSFQEGSGGKRISIYDLVIKAAALALREVPQCNSSWSEDHIRQYHNVNINVAVQTDHGLCMPVIKNADKKGISTISEKIKYLAQKAKENSLKPEDFEGGTFTVSNLGGSFGISQFCAIINPPQAGILAVGSAEKRIIPGSDLLRCELASFMSATLSCDHRVVDGAVGAEWVKAFKGYIENPESMLL